MVITESKPYSNTVVWELSSILEHGREKLEVKKTEVEEELEAKSKAEADEKEAE